MNLEGSYLHKNTGFLTPNGDICHPNLRLFFRKIRYNVEIRLSGIADKGKTVSLIKKAAPRKTEKSQ